MRAAAPPPRETTGWPAPCRRGAATTCRARNGPPASPARARAASSRSRAAASRSLTSMHALAAATSVGGVRPVERLDAQAQAVRRRRSAERVGQDRRRVRVDRRFARRRCLAGDCTCRVRRRLSCRCTGSDRHGGRAAPGACCSRLARSAVASSRISCPSTVFEPRQQLITAPASSPGGCPPPCRFTNASCRSGIHRIAGEPGADRASAGRPVRCRWLLERSPPPGCASIQQRAIAAEPVRESSPRTRRLAPRPRRHAVAGRQPSAHRSSSRFSERDGAVDPASAPSHEAGTQMNCLSTRGTRGTWRSPVTSSDGTHER